MKEMLKYLLLILFAILVSCEKEEGVKIPDVEDDDSTYSQYGTPFDQVPGTEDIIMYEVNLRAFSERGDLQGVIERLDEMEDLNINVIWLMPIHPIGDSHSVNSPYSVKNYKEVNPEFGSLKDLRELTNRAHERGMAVLMDWVANHTAWDNPWIINKDWYTQDNQGNIVHPPGTNWMDVADLDFSNDTMRAAMIDAMKFWVLEANVDGFRCDYADGVPFDFWEQTIDTLRSIPGRDLIMLAEGSRISHFTAGFDLIFGWDFYFRMIDVFEGQPASLLYSTHLEEYRNIPEGKHRLRYTTNHDESAWSATPMMLFNGEEGAVAASVVTMFMGGAPLIYTGQETGRVENVPFFSNSPITWDNNPGMTQTYEMITGIYSEANAARSSSITDYSNNNVVCFAKNTNDQELLVIVNMRDWNLGFVLPLALQNTSWMNALTSQPVDIDLVLPMNSYQYYILLREQASNN